MSIEETVKHVFQQVLDVKPNEIQPDVRLDDAFGVDSTEMVEINVGLKKALGLEMANNELKKQYSFNEIVKILKAKGAH